MTEAQKDTIYIDVDDEITSVIDKVRQSKHKIVALVLPKRATVMQSIVNMKLLKRTSEDTKKRVVLITSEASLLPLAGAVQLHVAKTLQSKPAIPEPPTVPSADVALDEADELDDQAADDEPTIDKSKPVGDLAKKSNKSAAKPSTDETIELDDDALDEASAAAATDDTKKSSRNKKLKVPNFNSFRKRFLLIGAALIGLIVFWYFAIFVMPRATITVKSDAITSNAEVTFTANTAAKTFDEEKSIIPATSKEVKKSDSVKVSASGKKNVGDKAKGSVSLRNCTKTDGTLTIPGGTVVTNAGLGFTTDADLTLPASTFTGGGKCTTADRTVDVTAQNSGDQYNLSGGRVYAVNGYGSVNGTDSSAMVGGTTKNVTVVSDQDVDNAKQQLADKSKTAAQTELAKILQDANLLALQETINGSSPTLTPTPKVGEEATEVTVTSVVTYTMLGIKQDDLKTLVINAAKKDIDTTKQQINDDGLSKAVYRSVDKKSPTEQRVSVQSTVSTGVNVDENELKKQIAGKKRGDVQTQISSLPGVKDVQVKYSPFWVTVTPKKAGQINLVFQKQ